MIINSKRISDNQLIEGIRGGEPRRCLFETTLYNRYAHLIQTGMRKHQLSQDECFNAYSDTILSVIAQVLNGRFAGRSSLKTYLYRIFTNKCVDLVRSNSSHRKRVHRSLGSDDTLLALPDPARSIVEQLSAKYDVDELQQKLRLLSPKSQKLILAWGEGYSDEEIAKRLDYNSAAVAKTSRLRSLKQLYNLYAVNRS